MEQRIEINFSLVLLLSAALHLFIVLAFFLPQVGTTSMREMVQHRAAGSDTRDVIVNINADDQEVETDATLLSDKNSSARGHITKDYGDTWLNNSQEFRLPKSAASSSSGSSSAANASGSKGASDVKKTAVKSASDEADYPIAINLIHESALSGGGVSGSMAESEWTKIPDMKGINMKNALFLSSDGSFSFNTKKFADYEYFRSMKSKVGSNWYPPTFANGVMPESANSRTGSYTPGYTMIRMIPSQEVRLYFTMDRQGVVKDVVIVDSMGNEALDGSCVKAIRNVGSFGEVPKDIPGELVVIPFIFGYYVY